MRKNFSIGCLTMLRIIADTSKTYFQGRGYIRVFCQRAYFGGYEVDNWMAQEDKIYS